MAASSVIDFLYRGPHIVRKALLADGFARLFQVCVFGIGEFHRQRDLFLRLPLDTAVLLVLVQAGLLTLCGGDLYLVQGLLFGVEVLEIALFGQDGRGYTAGL